MSINTNQITRLKQTHPWMFTESKDDLVKEIKEAAFDKRLYADCHDGSNAMTAMWYDDVVAVYEFRFGVWDRSND